MGASERFDLYSVCKYKEVLFLRGKVNGQD